MSKFERSTETPDLRLNSTFSTLERYKCTQAAHS